MCSVQRDSDGTVGCGDEFGEALAALRREGCAFLVAGDAPPSVHARAAEEFLGDGDHQRMVLLSDDAHRPEPTAGTGPTVVRYGTAVRGGAAATAGEADTASVATDLAELGHAALEEIEQYEAAAERPPGGLRLVVLSAAPLVADHDEQQVFAWLHLLTGRVRQADGMAFVHLPVAPGEGPGPTLRPLFDGLVELRADAGGQQRWHLEDDTSEWMAL